MFSLGRTLIVVGLGLAAVGALLVAGEKLPWLRLGRLPGDLRYEHGSFRLYLPLATSLVVSAVLSLLLWLFGRR